MTPGKHSNNASRIPICDFQQRVERTPLPCPNIQPCLPLECCVDCKIEEKAADEAARAKEAEEQAALPYKWTQAIGDLDITAEIPGNLKAKDLVVDIKKTKLVVGIKGQEPIISVSFTSTPILTSIGTSNIIL